MPKYQQFDLVGFVILVEDNHALVMQNVNSIEKVYFPIEYKIAFQKTKRRIAVISNVTCNDHVFAVRKLKSLKVLKIKTDDWWRVGPAFGVEVCPRLSIPSEFHPRWPSSNDNEGGAQFMKAHAALKNFMERVNFHNKNGFKHGFTMLDRLIISKKMPQDRIDVKKINSNGIFTPPQLRSPIRCPPPPKKARVVATVRPIQVKSKRNLNLAQPEVIDLSVESSSEESEDEPEAEDIEFLDDSNQVNDGQQIGAQVKFNKDEIKAFHDEVIELIGQLSNQEPFHLKTNLLTTSQFCRILQTASPCDKIDLMSLVRSIPTNTFNLSEERTERLFGDLLQATFNFVKL